MKLFKDFLIIRIITLLIIPYIFLLVLYIQINGENSPGGGFQAGAICASCLIGYEIIFGPNIFEKYITLKSLVVTAILGTLIYLLTGFIPMLFKGNYLAYEYITLNSYKGHVIGIFLIEIGVGLTILSIMSLIYLLFRKGKYNDL